MAVRKQTVFTVEGKGEFPFDMLRYDQCWPKSSEDATALQWDVRRGYEASLQLRTVTLVSDLGREPTAGRWQSFGWKVTQSEIRRLA